MSERPATQITGSRRRASGTLGYIPPVHEPSRTARLLGSLAIVACALGWTVGTAAAATAVVAAGEPRWLSRYGAALLTFVLAVVLTHRCGARVAVWSPLVAGAIVVSAVVELNWMYSAMSVVAAVVSSVLAVMITRPALGTVRVIGEYLLAVTVAASGALAVAAWNAPLVYQRYNLLVLALALLLSLGVVWGLGAGLHGLGRRGFVLIVGTAALLALVLAYGAAVRTYGSPTVVQALDDAVFWMREHVRGVPRPAEVLVGFPALVWGIGTRAHRRQGWWMCVFGVVGTASVATSLASPDALPSYVGVSTLYSVVLGLVVGLVVSRLDPGSRTGAGRRARRDDPGVVTRPEAPRTESLK